jgi:hypothetical protein
MNVTEHDVNEPFCPFAGSVFRLSLGILEGYTERGANGHSYMDADSPKIAHLVDQFQSLS